MAEKDVLDWFKDQNGVGINRGFTIKEIQRGLRVQGNSFCVETIWRNVICLYKRNYLLHKKGFPVKWGLNTNVFNLKK